MKNYEHNVKLLEAKGVTALAGYDNAYKYRPTELIEAVQIWADSADGKPLTEAWLCHHLKVSRNSLRSWLNSKGYDGARTAIHNILLNYCENYLFTGKNVNGAVFYMKNAFPQFYQDKQTTETNVTFNLRSLSKRADKMERDLKKNWVVKWEIIKSKLRWAPPKDWNNLAKRLEEEEKQEENTVFEAENEEFDVENDG